MKRMIEASITPEEGEALAIETFGSSDPGLGNIYISPDGTFINLYPEIDTHEDLCWWLEEEKDCQLEYEDEEYFIREFRWIRLRSDPTMMIIELTEERPFNAQWYSLEEWLLYCEDRYAGNGTTLYLNVCDGNDADVEYKFGTEYFAEDIMRICKRYYTSGKLYSSTEEDNTMKKIIKGGTNVRETIFEDEYFDFVETHGIGVNDTPWSGLAVVSKGLAVKHVVEIRLNSKGMPEYNGDPIEYEYKDAYVTHGMRATMDTLEETEEYIEVLEDAVDFARRVNEYLYRNYDINDFTDVTSTTIHASSEDMRDPNWIDPEILMDEGFDVNGSEMDEVWRNYLSVPEESVYNEFDIITEGSSGTMYIEDYRDKVYPLRFEPIEVDWTEWCENEIQMAIDSNNAEEYKQKFRAYIKDLCNI